MSRIVLLASRDEPLDQPRASVLRRLGYITVEARGLGEAMRTVRDERPDLVILGNSFDEFEQGCFTEVLQESWLHVPVICFRNGLVTPDELLHACHRCLENNDRDVILILPAPASSAMIAWPALAS